MKYSIVRDNVVVEEGDVIESVPMMSFLNSLRDKVEEGDLFRSARWSVMYTGYGTWRSISADMLKFWDMELNLKSISTLRRGGATLNKILSMTEREFTKLYGKRIAKDVAEGLAMTGRSFKDGPSASFNS